MATKTIAEHFSPVHLVWGLRKFALDIIFFENAEEITSGGLIKYV